MSFLLAIAITGHLFQSSKLVLTNVFLSFLLRTITKSVIGALIVSVFAIGLYLFTVAIGGVGGGGQGVTSLIEASDRR